MPASYFALVAAAIFCVVRAVVDFRNKDYFWAALSAVLGLAILCTPIGTHAITIDLPSTK